MTDTDVTIDDSSPGAFTIRHLGVAGSAVLCGDVSICLLTQPDLLAPVVLIPTWCWLLPGLMLAFAGFSRFHKGRFIAVLLSWTAFTWLFVEEAHSLLRVPQYSVRQWQSIHANGRGLRVVSLNCNVGQVRCVEEIAVWEPDLVVLQESPGNDQLKVLTETLFGDEGRFLHGGDVSIMARGQLNPRFVDRNSHFIHAEVELTSGIVAEVMSVRLSPPVPRLDFWMPGFWPDHREIRIEHRDQVQQILRQVQSADNSTHVIVGGDFNAPPNDDALSALRSRLTDQFLMAGQGWGATGTNDYPLFRVDQMWAGQSLRANSVLAQKTEYSDHRLVVCDLVIVD